MRIYESEEICETVRLTEERRPDGQLSMEEEELRQDGKSIGRIVRLYSYVPQKGGRLPDVIDTIEETTYGSDGAALSVRTIFHNPHRVLVETPEEHAARKAEEEKARASRRLPPEERARAKMEAFLAEQRALETEREQRRKALEERRIERLKAREAALAALEAERIARRRDLEAAREARRLALEELARERERQKRAAAEEKKRIRRQAMIDKLERELSALKDQAQDTGKRSLP